MAKKSSGNAVKKIDEQIKELNEKVEKNVSSQNSNNKKKKNRNNRTKGKKNNNSNNSSKKGVNSVNKKNSNKQTSTKKNNNQTKKKPVKKEAIVAPERKPKKKEIVKEKEIKKIVREEAIVVPERKEEEKKVQETVKEIKDEIIVPVEKEIDVIKSDLVDDQDVSLEDVPEIEEEIVLEDVQPTAKLEVIEEVSDKEEKIKYTILEKEMRSLYDKVESVVDDIDVNDQEKIELPELSLNEEKVEKVDDNKLLNKLILILGIIFIILLVLFIAFVIYVCTF